MEEIRKLNKELIPKTLLERGIKFQTFLKFINENYPLEYPDFQELEEEIYIPSSELFNIADVPREILKEFTSLTVFEGDITNNISNGYCISSSDGQCMMKTCFCQGKIDLTICIGCDGKIKTLVRFPSKGGSWGDCFCSLKCLKKNALYKKSDKIRLELLSNLFIFRK